jgi:LAO/AO transport system kinase
MSELTSTVADLVGRLLQGDRRALARAITWVENETPGAPALLDAIYPRVGRAYRVGITGPPGAGKSTLTAALAGALREADRTVGIVAVDPSSPFSGGAVLGDRIRMTKVATDPGVFIRSMASRGALGGLARATRDVCDVMDAAGRDVVVIETVGVGQAEVDIAQAADTAVVVLSPESGDGIQTMKAGLMEIADVFCVNKADRDGADNMVRAIRAMLSVDGGLRAHGGAGHGSQAGGDDAPAPWRVPVLRTVATSGDGIGKLLETLDAHRAHLEDRGLWHELQSERANQRIRRLVEEALRARLWDAAHGGPALERLTGAVLEGTTTPQQAAHELLSAFERRLRPDA